MDTLKQLVRDTVFWYAGGGFDLRTYPLSNEEQAVYAVNIVQYPKTTEPAGIVVQARVEGDFVVIEEDTTDRPLIDKLLDAGIPREKIIRAYAGEAIPTTEEG